MVEAVGIEPTSEKRTTEASTCLVYVLSFPKGPHKHGPGRSSP